MTTTTPRALLGAAATSLPLLLLLLAAAPPAGAQVPYAVQTPPLDTPWTSQVDTAAPWPQHPRPQLRRADDAWRSLNGIWTYQAADGNATTATAPPPARPFEREVLIPSCIESALSGLQVLDVSSMWFETTFSVPAAWGAAGSGSNSSSSSSSVMLHFEAVDYESTVFVNDQQVGTFRGGYFRNSIDVTSYLSSNGTNELKVFVFDPTDLDGYVVPIGKQTKNPEHIWYRPCSGIWQTVWLESVPASSHISQLDVKARADGSLTVLVHASDNSSAAAVSVDVLGTDGAVLATGTGTAGTAFDFTADGVAAWTPDAPSLYNLTVTMGADRVSSYTGFRTVGVGRVDGVQRPLLNGEFVFQFATLDQGYWPDGLYTPPTYEAMVFDLEELKKLGFNTVRKHIKIEPDLFYWACDTMGLMVIQDMPSMSPRVPAPTDAEQADFESQIALMVNEHLSYPSIVTWVIYNEGWGQRIEGYPEYHIAEAIDAIDGSRNIDATTGWNDHGAGDFSDNHHYAGPQCGTPYYSISSSPYDSNRVGFQGEFGGIGHNVSIEHLWNVQQAIDAINQTYEINLDLASFNYRSHVLLDELRSQVELFSCSGGVWTQTTDVEGEVNGLLTYDRRVERVDVAQWQADIQALYDAAAGRGGSGNSTTASMARLRI